MTSREPLAVFIFVSLNKTTLDPEVLQQTRTRALVIGEADISLLYPNLGFGHSRGEGERRHWLLLRSILPHSCHKSPPHGTAAVEPGGRAAGAGGSWERAPNSPGRAWPPSTAGRAGRIQQRRAPSSDPTNVTAGSRRVKEQRDGWESERGRPGMWASLRGTSAGRSQTSKHP